MPSVESIHAYTTVPGGGPSLARELSRGPTLEEGITTRTADEENIAQTRVNVARLLMETKEENIIEIDSESVYGSAFVLPQIARSAGCPPKLVVLCLRSFFFLILNCLLQWMLVYELVKEAQVMNRFSGVMWLCDFGAQKDGCPEADGCRGPGGTRMTPSRSYAYNQWSLQKFVKDSLLAVFSESQFPDRHQEINDNIDPGEYGVESAKCRLLCVMLFVCAVSHEFVGIMKMLKLLYSLPPREESWVSENAEGEAVLTVKGMPWRWKFINFVFVLGPRFILWAFTARTGMLFLMETATIENTIVNTTALCFILDIDELLFEVFSTDLTKYMLDILEGFRIPGKSTTISRSLSREEEDYLEESSMNHWLSSQLIPWNALQAAGIFVFFYWLYYNSHCVKSEDGTYVSISMYTPKSTDFSDISAFLPQLFPIESEKTPYWTWQPKD